MSVETRLKRISVPQITAMKGSTPIVCLTAYTSLTAVLLDDNVDLLLVGDSLGMVLYGMDSTLGVTLEMMVTRELGDPFRRDALALPTRHLAKYKSTEAPRR